MNAMQMIGAVFTVLGVVFLTVVVFGHMRVPAGRHAGLARQDGLLPAGAGLVLVGIVLMAR